MEIEMQARMIQMTFLHLDTNLINARNKLENMNQIEKWVEDGVIDQPHMSGVAFKEAQAGGNRVRTQKALAQIFTGTDETLDQSDPRYREMEAVLSPGGAQTDNECNDVKIVYEADRWGAILVTRDGGILGKRKLLKGVQILSDSEVVALIREKIRGRDDHNRWVAREFGGELPAWTGKD